MKKNTVYGSVVIVLLALVAIGVPSISGMVIPGTTAADACREHCTYDTLPPVEEIFDKDCYRDCLCDAGVGPCYQLYWGGYPETG